MNTRAETTRGRSRKDRPNAVVPHTIVMMSRPDSPTLSSALDQAFMARVHKTSLVMAGLVAVVASMSTLGVSWALGFLGCAVWSTANLWTLERLVRGSLQPGPADKIALAMGILIKLPVLYGLLVLLLFFGNFPATAVMIGVSVPLAVIVLKVAGRMLALRLRAGDAGIPEPRS